MTSAYAGRRVMLLGAGGFIGSWMQRALVEGGAHVVAVLRPGHLKAGSGLAGSVVYCDLRDSEALRQEVRAAAPDVVFNMAGYGVYSDQADAEYADRINRHIIATLVDAVAELGNSDWAGARIVHAGSAAEYGDAGGDLRETVTARPSTLYGRTKLAGTMLLAERSAARSIPSVSARLFTVYGSGERAGRLVPTLMSAAMSEEPIPLTYGTQRRDFVHVDDAVSAMMTLGTAKVGPGEIVNVATGTLHSVKEFVEIAAAVLKISPDRLRFGAIAERAGEMHHSAVNVAKLVDLTGWRPSITPAEGISRTRQSKADTGQAGSGVPAAT